MLLTEPSGDAAEALDRADASDTALFWRDDVSRGKSGLNLITSNLDAFSTRMHSARGATKTLDLLYYMWNADLTGMLMMSEALAAADRGVRIRILLDDIGVSLSDRVFRALDSHPMIELRLFNPTKARENRLRRGLEMVLRFRSVNRRMHNKAWIADGEVAIVGGRNIGDEYFDAGKEANFRDFDLVVVGKSLEAMTALFEDYWNSDVVVPVRTLLPKRTGRLRKLREKMAELKFLEAAKPYVDHVSKTSSLHREEDFIWVDQIKVLADPPEKAAGRRRNGKNFLMDILLPVMTGARDVLNITSPYFIPGSRGVAALTALRAKGTAVSVLTNSLAATDVAAVHAGYSRYRSALLKEGVRLFELRSRSGNGSFSLRGSGQASLHTKAFSRDRRYGFIGSLNLDPRSISLNTEMGILFESPALVKQMDAVFSQELDPDMSYQVSIHDRTLSWKGKVDGEMVMFKREPDASVSKRAIAWLISWLPLESQL